jgi:hypothetical protein
MTGVGTLKTVLRPPKDFAVSCLRLTREAARDLALFGKGYLSYLLRRKHDPASYLAMRRLFCVTNGRFNDALAYCHRAAHPQCHVDLRGSLLPELERGGLARAVRALGRDGYHVFDRRLTGEMCQALTAFARATPCTVIGWDGKTKDDRLCFDPARPAGVRYDLGQQEVAENPAAQRLIADPGLLALAQGYFRAKAVQDMVAMWWSVPSPDPNSAAAQLYHFDLDRLKFLKFFFYLTDVDEKNGPHCFIAGSHRRLPKAVCKDGRHTDEDVYAHFPPEKRIEIKGPRGTICAVDTRGLHKGKQLIAGHRLIFQIEYAINDFGMHYDPIVLNESFSPEFLAAARRYPYAFANYVPGTAGPKLNLVSS